MLSPHTDDVELGCGGTIARFVEDGEMEIHVAVFSTAEESLPKNFRKDALRQEFLRSMEILGIPKKWLTIHDYVVRKLSYRRQDVLEEAIEMRKSVDPDLVFLPSSQDLHQDHQTVYNEGLRAFKSVTMWGYELPWNTIAFPARGFVTLEERHIRKKWEAMQAYKSQLSIGRPYFTFDYVKGLATVRGIQVNSKYAEAFEVVREKW
jgi:LmbE family N-acetylglucosaminyl deacetylase